MMSPTAVWRSVLARPLTTLYILASLIIVGASAGWLDRNLAVAVLTFMFLILITLGLHRENRIVAEATNEQLSEIHVLVNSQHDDLVERVEQLIQALTDNEVTVPKAKGGQTP